MALVVIMNNNNDGDFDNDNVNNNGGNDIEKRNIYYNSDNANNNDVIKILTRIMMSTIITVTKIMAIMVIK